MDIDEAKQIVKDYFSPYDSEIEPNNENSGTFNLVVYKDKSKNGIYDFSQLDISNMSERRFLILVKETKKSLQKDCKFVFDNN